MKTLKKIFLTFILLMGCINLNAQESKDAKQASPEDKAMMAYMTPGKMHDMLAKSAGLWNEDVTMWMSPDAPPVKGVMTAMNRMIMGNRYLQCMNRGTFMGMPFEGISTIGYDNAKNVFMSTWIDNMGTGIMYAEGKWNESNSTIDFTGKSFDPMSGKDVQMRQVMKFIDETNQLMEMYMTPMGGKEYKSMEIKSTKKQDVRTGGVKPIPTPTPPPAPADKKK